MNPPFDVARRGLVAGLTALSLAAAPAVAQTVRDTARWRAEAARTQIVRDDWGIAHVHGRSDADAVFAMVYAQAEDDFNRVETNFLTALGRRSEAEGEAMIFADLRQRLFVDPEALRADYRRSPPWLRRLMAAWADGLNYYLATHREARPRALKRFEPWMALSFSEGSIGGDIEKTPIEGLRAFYGDAGAQWRRVPDSGGDGDGEPRGSNGIAIAPSNTRDGHALLLINPHTSFFFRSELQVASDQGLNAYGAATWGQFFLYQGFNPRLGWMHTTSGADTVDEFAETIVRKAGRVYYRFGGRLLPMKTRSIRLLVSNGKGGLEPRFFRTYASLHGPIVRNEGGRWIAAALMNKPVAALSQSFQLTKARTWREFMKAMTYRANSSNNTIYADADGHIAYLHPQFIPRRDDRFDFTRPVDGSDPSTAWQGEHALSESPRLLDPPNGWIMNTNDWPYSAAGPYSPKAADFPRYMDQAGENPRGLHATLVLSARKDFTLDGLRDAAFDSYLPAFDSLLPPLFRDYDALPASDPLKAELKASVDRLRGWNRRWSAESVETSIAVFWGESFRQSAADRIRQSRRTPYEYMETVASPAERLAALKAAQDRLLRDFGKVATPWGDINRFQRITNAIDPVFDDTQPSIPVPFTSATWGSLASFGAKPYPGTRRWYGTSGNSFVAAVEFGPKVRAVAVTAGGESGRMGSPHFTDEAARYASGALRPVYFYPEELRGHTERTYRPGE